MISIAIDHLLKETFHLAMAKRGFEEMMEHTSASHTAVDEDSWFAPDTGPQTIEQLWFWPTIAISRLGQQNSTAKMPNLFQSLSSRCGWVSRCLQRTAEWVQRRQR